MARSGFVFTLILACWVIFNCGTLEDVTGQTEMVDRSWRTEDGRRNWGMFNPAVTNGENRTIGRRPRSEDRKPASSVKRGSKSHGLCPHERKEHCLVLALSRIAKVQVAEYAYHPASREPSGKVFREQKKSAEHAPGRERQKGDEGSVSRESSNKRLDGNVHCRATREVYIPEAKKTLPAFICKLGNTTFLLSSTRFLEDRKSYLDLKVEDTAFQDIGRAAKLPRSNEFNVVPALLVLRNGDNNYRVRTSKKAYPATET